MPRVPKRGGDEKPSNARALSLPERPSLEQLRKRAKDLLRAARAGEASALARIAAGAPSAKRNAEPTLSEAQRAIAREYGFEGWTRLVRHIEATAVAVASLRPLIRPVEMRPGRPWTLDDGTVLSTDDVYAMFVAARDGDLAGVKRLVGRASALATVEYNYTPPIHFAVREGHRAIVELLLDHGADVAYRSYPFQEALLTFAEDRSHHDVADLLRRRLERRFAIGSGTEAIIAAADRGDAAAVAAELERNRALARAGNETGDTPLHHAAQRGRVDVVRVLLSAGADVDAVRGDGSRPIHCALMPNWFFARPSPAHEEIATLLLAAGAQYTMFVAAMRGDMSYVRDAVARDGSLANFADTCRQRVLSAAVRRQDVAMTRLLLDHGADPNLPEIGAPHGTALWSAVSAGNREIVEMLLARGADPNAPVESSGTPMLPAQRHPELLELLRAHGGGEPASERDDAFKLMREGRYADAERLLREHPEWIHDEGWGDGIIAGPARDGNHELIAMFLRLGARIPTVSKWAPFYYFKHEATAAFLLDHGMDPDHMNWHRFTLLHHMAARGETGKARLLLDHGASINAIDDEYRSTPLGVAARFGQRSMIELLLDRGADASLAGAPWAAPLAWAERKSHAKIAELLRARSG